MALPRIVQGAACGQRRVRCIALLAVLLPKHWHWAKSGPKPGQKIYLTPRTLSRGHGHPCFRPQPRQGIAGGYRSYAGLLKRRIGRHKSGWICEAASNFALLHDRGFQHDAIQRQN